MTATIKTKIGKTDTTVLENPTDSGLSRDEFRTTLPNPSERAQRRVAQINEKRKTAMCYTLQDVADLLNVSYLTVWRLVQRGLLRTVPHIRTRLVPRAELERFINS